MMSIEILNNLDHTYYEEISLYEIVLFELYENLHNPTDSIDIISWMLGHSCYVH